VRRCRPFGGGLRGRLCSWVAELAERRLLVLVVVGLVRGRCALVVPSRHKCGLSRAARLFPAQRAGVLACLAGVGSATQRCRSVLSGQQGDLRFR